MKHANTHTYVLIPHLLSFIYLVGESKGPGNGGLSVPTMSFSEAQMGTLCQTALHVIQ